MTNDEALPNTPDEVDDALAEAVADALVALAAEPGPYRLTALQLAGLASDPPSPTDLAAAYSLREWQVRDIEKIACLRLAIRFPELRAELETLKTHALRGDQAPIHTAE